MSFPRPRNDNGFGLHDDGVSGPGTMSRIYSLLDEMRDLNFHWITLLFNVATEKQALIRYALDRDIMPIVRPYEQHPHPRSRIPGWFIQACRDQGAIYFQVWNEPNLPEEHNKPYNEYKYGDVTGHDAFVNLLLDQWLTDANAIRSLGGIPLFPPMSPTAYTNNNVYFHHRIYNDILRIAEQRGVLAEAFEGAGLAIHNRPCGLPLDSMDRCSFNDYIWIEETFKKKLGREILLFGAEAGYESGMITTWFANYGGVPNPTYEQCLQKHRELNHEIFLRMDPVHPKAWKPYLICQNMWLSHDGPVDWPGSGWKLNQWANGEAPAYKHMNDIVPFTRWEGTPPEPPPPPEKARGIDVSAWQGAIDWNAIATDGISFAYIRATQWDKETSSIVVDKYYDRNQQAAATAGLLRGAYHYLRSDVDPDRQAHIFVDTIKDHDLELPPMLDVEESSLTQAQVESFIQAFKAITTQELGAYTSVWKWDQELRLVGKCGAGPLWVAHWTDGDTPLLPKAWTTWEFWQYSNQGTVAGIQGRVDLDRFKGSEVRLREKYGKPEPPPPPPAREFVGLSQQMIERLSFEPPPDTSQPYWKAFKIEVQPYTNNASAFAIVPVGHEPTVTFYWAEGETQPEYKDDPYAPPGATVHAASMPMYAPWGGYGCRLEGNTESVFGFGLYAQNLDTTKSESHPVLIYWELVSPQPPPPPPPTDPAEVIVLLAKEELEGMPVPDDWALPAKAIEVGFPIQVGSYGRTEIDGETWAYQTFTRAEQDKYIVTFCKEGDWENVQWAEVIPD